MLECVFWDVQHGSATYIKTPNGKHLVVDLGTGTYGSSASGASGPFSPLKYLKDECGVEQLDGVIITHPHRDHLDDILAFDDLSPRVLTRPKNIPEDDIRAGNRKVDQKIIDKYLEINARYNKALSPEHDPYRPSNNGSVKFTKFFPTSAETSDLNNHSIVVVVEYAKSKLLITGDNEATAWKELLDRDDFRTAIAGTDILLAPHHGRESGYCEEFFEHISPKLTVVSDGRFCDTSATDRYSKKSSGWTVHRRSGGQKNRKCVTTRNDGVIRVRFGMNAEQIPFIEVTID